MLLVGVRHGVEIAQPLTVIGQTHPPLRRLVVRRKAAQADVAHMVPADPGIGIEAIADSGLPGQLRR